MPADEPRDAYDIPGMTGKPLTAEGESNARYLMAWAFIAPVVFSLLIPLVRVDGAMLATLALSAVAAVWLHDRRRDQRLELARLRADRRGAGPARR